MQSARISPISEALVGKGGGVAKRARGEEKEGHEKRQNRFE